MSSGKNIKSVEETFVKKTQLEHIIDIPDTYIGSVEKTDVDTWIYNEEDEKIIYKNIKYIPGLYKIFDEVLVNAIDQHVRTENDEKIVNKVNMIKVNFDVEKNIISVYNNGEGIPVVEHKEHNVWVPELIFGHLLTSSNYDKNEKKITGGKNGYGAKLANIFSKTFKIETVDAERKLKYVQVFEKNMTIKGVPTITKSTAKPYTIIEFSPDLERFGVDKLDDDTLLLMKKRVIDITACTNKNVSVFLNDKKLDCKTLEKYVNYYLDSEVEKVYEEVSDRWEVVVAINPDTKFEQVSFVNGISTVKGGKHVDYVANAIIKKVQSYVSTKGIKRKKLDLKPAHIKDNIFVFIRSTIENPAFDSQIKEYLTTPSTKFGSKCEVSDKFIEKLVKTSLIDRAMKLSDFKDNLGLQKVSGKKTTAIRGIDKLDDANKAGTNESLKCTLILTEGDSAKALAIAGLSVVGRDYFGVFPLRGKVLNVRDVTLKKVSDNNEINHLVKIMGLKFNSKNKDKEETLKDLRYGRIMIFTDADVDGSHIKGLIINLFAIFWPELLEIPGFIISLATPILKVKKNKESIEFYTMTEFNNWKENIENIKNWDIKYYKGLGTSTSEEAKGYFTNFDEKNIHYMINDKEEDQKTKELSFDKIELAFDKKRSEDRKSWLKTYDKDNIIEQSQKKILYHEFIDRELIHFSDYDCKRSLPCLCDGLKPSLRKIIYSCFKRNLKKEIKVAQLAGYISENSAYHHGEQSLYDSIIGLAQDYVGSNNIELLEPKGQFGCLSPETPILMWNGSIKRADEIRLGDKLVGDDGLERNVLKITSGIDDMYEINCHGEKYVVNSQHIITLYYPFNNRITWKDSNKTWKLEYFDGTKIVEKCIRTNELNTKDNEHFNKSKYTKENAYTLICKEKDDILIKYNISDFIDIKLEDYLKLSTYSKRKLYMISNTKCINWDKKDVKINPYILSAWLGDGNHEVRNKHIPKEYIFNDKDTRLKVLAGFIDTDGTLKKSNNGSPHYEISQSDRLHGELIDSLDFICKSLGFSTTISYTELTLKGENKRLKTLFIYGDNINEIPVLLEIKKVNYYARKHVSPNFKKFTITYLGKNNFNGWMIDKNERFLLGNFIVTHNSRINGGHDSASPRYIFTNLSELTFHIFNPLDNPLLEYNEDDGKKIEPQWYIPILPLILINGSEGIGTGFSTKIPPHDPEFIVKNLLNMMDDKPFEKMIPWFRGFRGLVEFKGINDYGLEQYINKGTYKIIDDTTVLIDELPIGKWTDDYKTFLESLLYDKSTDKNSNKQCLVDFSNNSTEKIVRYTLKFKKEDLQKLKNNNEIENTFKLTDCKYTNYSNMHLYNNKGIICKYDSIEEIMKEFYLIRLVYYTKRKDYMLKTMQKELDIYQSKIRFIEEFISGEINILQKEDEEIDALLIERNYPKFGSGNNDDNEDIDTFSYEYLLNMKIKSLTKKKIEELKKLHENKLAVYNELLLKSEKDLWKDDLNKFLDIYKKKLKEYDDKMNDQVKSLNAQNGSGKKTNKKK
jgi:DNA gyrase/topoisomerase IV subunit B